MTIVGDGPEKKNLVLLVKKLNISHIVSFIDYLSDDDLISTIKKSKICVFPSLAREGILSTLLEACILKSTIIAAQCCSFPEFIRDGVNGLLFKPKDAGDLAQKLALLLNDEKQRKVLARNAFLKADKIIENRFNNSTV